MPVFMYKARGNHGDAIEGTIDAGSTDAAAARLLESGLTPVDIRLHIEKHGLQVDLNELFKQKVEQLHVAAMYGHDCRAQSERRQLVNVATRFDQRLC